MRPVAVQVPLRGAYNSALVRAPQGEGGQNDTPPATSTVPLGSSVAVCSARATRRLPVTVHRPVWGSYTSALASCATQEELAHTLMPPATSTRPLGSSVAVSP
jgi:hypothetical protein